MNDREKLQATTATIAEARRTARATVADAILFSSTTDEQVRRGAKMRLVTLHEKGRASFLLGLERQGKLTRRCGNTLITRAEGRADSE